MEKRNQNKFKSILAIIVLIAVISLAIVTTIILNNRQKDLDDLNNKNDQLEEVISIDKNF